MNKDMFIMVVCGGISTEREISLKSGSAVYGALRRKGYCNVELFDMSRSNIAELLARKPEAVFLALHGKGGEDGSIQGMLELAGIPYTGSGVCSSAVCMNKILTKRLLESVGIPTARFAVYNKGNCSNIKMISQELLDKFSLPFVIKSPCQGSSIGVFIVKSMEEIPVALNEVFKLGDSFFAEQFLDGVEITLPVMGNSELRPLPVIEITSERDFYDYTAKYTLGLCHHIIPACIDKTVEQDIIAIGKKTYSALGCSGFARIDFIIDKMLGPMVIEVNTLPGMTDMSLFPDSARYAGISYENLVEMILEYGISAEREF